MRGEFPFPKFKDSRCLGGEGVAEQNQVDDCTFPFPGAAGSRDREGHYVSLDGALQIYVLLFGIQSSRLTAETHFPSFSVSQGNHYN